MIDPRLDELIDKHLAGEPTSAELEELNRMLIATPEARDRLTRQARDLVELGALLGRPLPPLPRLPATGRRLRLAPTLVMAAGLIALVLGLVRLLGPGTETPRTGDRQQAATEGGDRSTLGNPIRRLVLGSATVTASPDARWEPGAIDGDGRQQIALRDGQLEVEVGGRGPGVLIETPEGRVVDIGTRFSVAVAGGTRVAVSEGRVRFEPAAAGPDDGFEFGPQAGALDLHRDGRLAELVEGEGLVWVRPATASRRSALARNEFVRAGDLVGTGSRGAHAAALRLNNGGTLYLGPASRLEFLDGESVRLDAGDFVLELPEGAGLILRHGRGAEIHAGAGTTWLRADDRGLERLDRAPSWFEAFKGDRLAESMGSLIAEVDGRDLPLTIGQHRVTVDIHDQIARTRIDQTFVNHSGTRLEGTFYFPLPPDASVSSFAMWVGDTKVEGEIVERDRARQIYETLLRERRDPGLLEWSGGSVFKARVFPIDAEKRIQISYTQVLPARRGLVRYRQPLRSELLRRHPLDRLQIELKIHSAAPILDLSCPSHIGRSTVTEHAASFEYEAERIVPDRDFELTYRLPEEPGHLRVVPHRRGDDGYFMAMVQPRILGGDDRGLLPDGEARDFIVLVDNSGSVDDEARRTQVAFLEAFMTSLRPEDTINVALFDVGVDWVFAGPMPADERSRDEALKLLESFEPLGWTDHARALREARARARAGSRIILLGDGADSLRSLDLGAFGRELAASWKDGPAVDVVALGNRCEDLLLEDLAALGRGSLHRLGEREAAPALARELLAGILEPGLADLQIEFEGVPTAAVHQLGATVLPRGVQAVLVGRFDPSQVQGETRVRLRGRQGDADFGAECRVDLGTADSGNSFIPRLWARRHLDQLLRQGSAPANVRRIIDLSAAFQIATPYTSFLVLETEEDRARFGISRSLRMRDGEDFFAAGREAADFQLVKAQLERSQSWRRELAERVLAKYRDAGAALMGELYGFDGYWGQPVDAGTIYLGLARDALDTASLRTITRETFDAPFEGAYDLVSGLRRQLEISHDFDLPAQQSRLPYGRYDRGRGTFGYGAPAFSLNFRYSQPRYGWDPEAQRREAYPLGCAQRFDEHVPDGEFGRLFPQLAPPRPQEADEDRPQRIRDLTAALDGLARLRGGDSGHRLRWSETYASVSAVEAPQALEALIGAAGLWCRRPRQSGTETVEDWLIAGRRGVWSDLWQVGRERAAEVGDDRNFAWPLPALMSSPLARHHGDRVVLRELEDGRIELDFPPESERDQGERFQLALAPTRLLVIETYTLRGPSGRIECGDHVDLNGFQMPRSIRISDGQGELVAEQRIEVETIEPEDFDRELAARRRGHEDALFIAGEASTLFAARARLLKGKAKLVDLLLLADETAGRGRTLETAGHYDAILALVGDRPVAPALRLAWAGLRGEKEDLADELRGLARAAATAARSAEITLARQIMDRAQALAATERLELLDLLEPVVARCPRPSEAQRWRGQVIAGLNDAGRSEELETRLETFIAAAPENWGLHLARAELLLARGDLEAGVAELDHLIATTSLPADRQDELRRRVVDELWRAGRHGVLIERFTLWGDRPEVFDHHRLGLYLQALLHEGRDSRFDETVLAWLALSERTGLDRGEILRLQVARIAGCGRLSGLPLSRHDLVFLDALVADGRRAAFRDNDHQTALGLIESPFGFRPELVAFGEELERRALAGRDELPLATLLPHAARLRGQAQRDLVGAMVERFLAQEGLENEWLILDATNPDALADLNLRVLEHLRGRATNAARRNELDQRLYWQLRRGKLGDEDQKRMIALCCGFEVEAETAEARREGNLVTRLRALEDLLQFLTERCTTEFLERRGDLDDLGPRAAAAARDEARQLARQHLDRLLGEPGLVVADDLRPWITFYRLDQRGGGGQAATTTLDEVLQAARAALIRVAGAEDRASSILAERLLCLAARLALEVRRPEAIDDLLDLPELEGWPARDRLRLEWLCASGRDQALATELDRLVTAGGTEDRIRWSRARAWTLAAANRLDEAIDCLRRLDRLEPLEADDQAELATWLQLRDDRAGRDLARRRRFESMDYWVLNAWLHDQLGRLQARGPEATEPLGEEIPVALAVQFARAAEPSQQIWLLRQYWATTRDHRLLAAAVESIARQSRHGLYDLLASMRFLVEDIHEEAAIDLIESRLVEELATETDARRRHALSLMRFQVCERALAQRHGTAGWRRSGLAALDEIDPARLQRGERRRCAAAFALAGRIEDVELRRRVLDLVAVLHRDCAVADEERSAVATSRADLLWNNDDREAAVAILEADLAEIGARHDGRLPEWTRPIQDRFATHLLELGQAARAEAFWRAELARPYPPKRRAFVRQRLLASLAELARSEAGTYRRVRDEWLRLIREETDAGTLVDLLGALRPLWRHARVAEAELVAQDLCDLRAGAASLLTRHRHERADQIARGLADALRDGGRDEEAFELLLDLLHQDPSHREALGQPLWKSVARFMAYIHEHAPDVPGPANRARFGRWLDRELEADLVSGIGYDRCCYSIDSNRYWIGSAERFATVARSALDHRPDDPRLARRIAAYLADGLEDPRAASDFLAAFDGRRPLAEDGLEELLRYARDGKDLERALATVDRLLALDDDRFDRHCLRIELLAELGRTEAAKRAFELVEERHHEPGRTPGPVLLRLADLAWRIGADEASVRLHRDFIRLMAREGRSNEVSHEVHGQLGESLLRLGRSDEAVDEAAAAVVLWPASSDAQARALARLRDILSRLPDREAFIARFEARLLAENRENPILRAALADVLGTAGQLDRAIVQLRLALAAAPEHEDWRRRLVELLDRAGRGREADRALLDLARRRPHDLDLWAELARRQAAAGDGVMARRAWTSLIEQSALEAEGPARFALAAEAEGRFAEAATFWERVDRLEPENARGLVGRLRCAVALGQRDLAVAIARTIRERFEHRGAELDRQIDENLDRLDR
ncbi:MAG: FecR domain-containing protein [Planctomycetes bacterium]|nr:FecR domain-containing protein [Planctomycetota bacterium]